MTFLGFPDTWYLVTHSEHYEGTENVGPENEGLKMQGWKMQDLEYSVFS